MKWRVWLVFHGVEFVILVEPLNTILSRIECGLMIRELVNHNLVVYGKCMLCNFILHIVHVLTTILRRNKIIYVQLLSLPLFPLHNVIINLLICYAIRFKVYTYIPQQHVSITQNVSTVMAFYSLTLPPAIDCLLPSFNLAFAK